MARTIDTLPAATSRIYVHGIDEELCERDDCWWDVLLFLLFHQLKHIISQSGVQEFFKVSPFFYAQLKGWHLAHELLGKNIKRSYSFSVIENSVLLETSIGINDRT